MLECYSWILDLFWQIIGGYDDVDYFGYVPDDVDFFSYVPEDVDYFGYVPDDLIINILSRLPAETILQCRKVCQKWRMLTSSFDLFALHQRNVKPLTLLHHGYHQKRLFIIDGKRKKECKVRGLKELEYAKYITSCNGLALLTHRCKYHVLNPLSSEGRITRIDYPTLGGLPCGFFFHPVAKEYRILSVHKIENGYEYNIYQFGSKRWRNTANPYFNYRPSCYRDFRSIVNGNAAIVNGCLHWYTIEGSLIMVFDMITEDFSERALPFEEYRQDDGLQQRDLLVNKDRLCFCNVICEQRVLDIWILEDYANWYWIKKYVVNLDWGRDQVSDGRRSF